MSNLFLPGTTSKYDKRLLYRRNETEGNVIACLLKDLTLLDDVKLDQFDFITSDGRFYFTLLNMLRTKGFNSVDEATIRSNVKENIIEKFDEKGGMEPLIHMTNVINVANFDAYMEELHKSNLLLRLYLDGFNMFEEISVGSKNVVPFDLFQKMTAQQVIDFYDSRLASMDAGESADIIEEEFVSFDSDWVDGLKKGGDSGVPFDKCGLDINGEDINGLGFLSNQTIGLHPGYLTYIAGFSSTGKSTLMVNIFMALLYRGEKIVIVSNEEQIQNFKVKFIMWILTRYFRVYSLTKGKLEAGDFTDEQKVQVHEAQEYWNKHYGKSVYFVSTNTADIQIVKKKVREAHLRWGFSVFAYDTFKLQDASFTGERQDLALIRDSRELATLARKYKMVGICSVQLAERYKGVLTLTATQLSNSKQIKEIANQMFMIRSVYPEELDPESKYYCRPFRTVREYGKWIEQPYDIDPTQTYIILFVEKNRNGEDTPSNGIGYLLKFEGRYSTFKEVAKVRCRHGIIQG